jgi:hypothetical protein
MKQNIHLKHAILERWEILKREVIRTAKRFHLRPIDGASELEQAVYFLYGTVVEGDAVMGNTYILATLLKRIEGNPDQEITVRDAEAFVKICDSITVKLREALLNA